MKPWLERRQGSSKSVVPWKELDIITELLFISLIYSKSNGQSFNEVI